MSEVATTAQDGSRAVAENGRLWVSRTLFRMEGGQKKEIEGGGKEVEESVQVGIFKSEPARVNCQVGLTINLGNFESARIDVGFNCPCYPEEMPEVYTHLKGMVEERVQGEVLEIRGKDIRPGHEAKRLDAIKADKK